MSKHKIRDRELSYLGQKSDIGPIFIGAAISFTVQNGTPLYVLQELGGWSDIKMVMRYAHLAPEHLAEYADNISNFGTVSEEIRTLSGTPGKGNKKAVTR